MFVSLGVHWIFDGHGASAAHIADEALIRRALDELPDRLGLRKVSTPQTFTHDTNGELSVAGLVLIAESHLSLHAFPRLSVIHGDLFSCKSFDFLIARNYLKDLFGIQTFDENVFERKIAPKELRQDTRR